MVSFWIGLKMYTQKIDRRSTFRQELMDRCIQHAIKNPIQSRGRTSISRMAALITNKYNDDYYGQNKYKTHPLMKRFSRSDDKLCLHAEIDALLKMDSYPDFSCYDIYIARVLKNNTPALAKPCSTCLGALTYFGIRNMYWTANDCMYRSG